MALKKSLNYLKKYNLEDRVIILKDSSATVKEAADALGITEGEIAKTLSFIVNDSPILILAAGDKKIDNAKYKEVFHEKAKMIPFDKVEELIGHAPGGVCPFGINDGVVVYLDESLKQYDIVYPAAGDAHSAVKLSIKELEEASNYKEWINVTK